MRSACPVPSLLKAVRRIDAVLHQQLQGSHRREVPALPVGGPDLHRGDDLAPTLDLRCRHGPGLAPIGAVGVFRAPIATQQTIQRGAADGVELGCRCHQNGALGMARRQRRKTAAESSERLDRHGARRSASHAQRFRVGAPSGGPWGGRDRALAAAPGRARRRATPGPPPSASRRR